MSFSKRWIIIFLSLLLSVGIIGCSTNTTATEEGSEQDNSESNRIDSGAQLGGLNVGMTAQPPTLDTHMSTAIASTYVMRQVFESLLTVNSQYEVVPDLAESVEESKDGLTYTFKLRENVYFHNGKELTSEDVVASLNRWKDTSPVGVSQIIKDGSFEAVEPYTVKLHLNSPSALALPILAANRYASIMPKEVIEEADETGVKAYIGTGPFEFVEWKQDQYIHLKKYEAYSPVELPTDGVSGKKEALVDNIFFRIVPDPSTLVAGVQTGEYDIIVDVPNEYYEQLKANQNLNVDVSSYGQMLLIFNRNEGPFTDVKLRQAVNAALDFESILLASFINEDLYAANPSHILPEHVNWYSEAGIEFYNQQNLDKAQQLLEESGYNGEEISILTTRDYEHIYNTAVVSKEQLDQIGMNVELEIYDWPTVQSKLREPSAWQIFSTGTPGKSTPVDILYFNDNYFDGPNDPEVNEFLFNIETATSQETASNYWNDMHHYVWETVPAIKLGDFMKVSAMGEDVEGFLYFEGPVLWNTAIRE